MEYSKLIAISGLTGLHELVASKNDGAIVKSLQDGQTRFVSSRKYQFSQLESIEIYTTSDNVNLLDIFKAMKANDLALPESKDSKALKAYFQVVFPDMDFDRVYVSDMKKMVIWFGLIDKLDITYPENIEETDAEAAETEAEKA